MGKVGTGAIPKTTTSMVKFIRTGEGMLVVAFNIALLVVPIISSALTPAQAVKWAAVINGVAVVARTGLKMTSLIQTGAGATPAAATAAASEAPDGATDGRPMARPQRRRSTPGTSTIWFPTPTSSRVSRRWQASTAT